VIYRLLCDQAAQRPGNVAVAGELSRLTYGQLLREVKALAAYLEILRLKREESILVGIPPSPAFYVIFYAASAVGATLIPVLPSERIPLPLLKANPAVAIGQESFLSQAKQSFPGVRNLLAWNSASGLQYADPPQDFRQRKPIRKEPILALSSSGTTGVPTIHYRSAEMILERAQLGVKILGVALEDVLLATRPFNNGSSLNNHIVAPLVAGCRVIVREKFQRFTIMEAIAQEKVTILYAVPFVFEVLASLPHECATDLSSLRLCVSAGAPLSASVWQNFFDRYGISIRQAYGASQISPLFTYNSSGVPGAVGHVSGPFPMAILDDRQRALGPGQVGEIAFDYSQLSRRWKTFFQHRPNRVGKYFLTGDLGRLDSHGNVYIVGRKSRFIKVGGNRVEPAEVEDVLRSHPLVLDVVVYALNPGRSDESVAAVIAPAGELTAEDIVRHCARRLDGYKCPKKIEFRTELRRNAHGKIVRHVFETGREA
jgi:long-chain acyl-CoA synthetase